MAYITGTNGNDSLNVSGGYSGTDSWGALDYGSKSDNTLNGGAGNDTLSASASAHSAKKN
ncbi:MAG: hypothetical protein HWQ38_33315 [Nostoc sp. NMS7]|uniref:hypothetical protein n=1 Tax=Nostoc sp. NMS7 TaxID=2815391 RepID=UPI0025FF1BA8|nr:hypothetical protein [Nostoc sp. NMS7]MBN3951093.1 hypothetical protein [Nostoc sp. NMS7]